MFVKGAPAKTALEIRRRSASRIRLGTALSLPIRITLGERLNSSATFICFKMYLCPDRGSAQTSLACTICAAAA